MDSIRSGVEWSALEKDWRWTPQGCMGESKIQALCVVHEGIIAEYIERMNEYVTCSNQIQGTHHKVGGFGNHEFQKNEQHWIGGGDEPKFMMMVTTWVEGHACNNKTDRCM